MKRTVVLLCLALAGCGGNQALLASGGPEDFVAMRHITDEYGTAEPDAVVPVMVGSEPYGFRVWIHKTKPKIMVQTDSMTGAAAAGFVRGLTMGMVKGDIEYEPAKKAAEDYLAATRGRDCRISNSEKLTHIGWEWDFECPPPVQPKPAAKR